jgi:2,4-dienoyl-CoA reductase (NADPH2)
MNNTGKFKMLCSPFQIRDMKLRNRIVKAPQGLRYNEKEGFVNDKVKGFYESIARGGTGLLTLEPCTIDGGPTGLNSVGLWDDKFIPGLTELVNIVHQHGCKVIPQLFHRGQGALQASTGLQPVAASSLSEDELPAPGFNPPRELSVAEIEDLIEKYARGAERARKSGFDGVEIHAAHSYLMEGFLSRVWNRRQDAYGGSLENRARIIVEIIKLIKERVGQDYPVGVRYNGQEWGTDRGITLEESQGIARILEKAGADYIHVSGFGYGSRPWKFTPDQWLYPEPTEDMKPYIKQLKKEGLYIPAAEGIKRAVSLPVIGVGNLTFDMAEKLLQKGKVDLVAFGRYLFADPAFPNKLCSGKLEDIAPCTHCSTCQTYTQVQYRRCRINAAMGYEQELAEYNWKAPEKKKKVMVVGGGPAGMEAARVAALRGHEVSLYERESQLGGLLPLASLVKGLEVEDLPAIVRYLKTQITRLGCKISLGKEVTPALIEEVKPDVVVLATGGAPAIPDIPGIDLPKVITSTELHRRAKTPLKLFGPRFLRWLTRFYLPVGKRVVVMGGLMEGCETAEFLVKRGRKVTMLETSDRLATGIPEGYIERIIPWLEEKGVVILSGIKYERVTDNGLDIVTADGKIRTIEADNILIAMPPCPNNDLFQALEKKVPEVCVIGSANGEESKLIVDAIAEGRRIGCTI